MNCNDGKRGRLVEDRRHQFGDERRLGDRSERLDRPHDRRLEFGGRHRRDRHRRITDQCPESLDGERPIVEVGAQCGHDVDPAGGVRDRGRDRVEKRRLLRDRRQREELLELVDDEEHRAVRRNGCRRRVGHGRRPVLQVRGQVDDVVDGDPSKSFGEFLERGRTGQHRGDEPSWSHLAVANRGNEAGAHDARLPAAGPADDERQPCGADRRDSRAQLADEFVAAVEVTGVRLVEGAEALERVDTVHPSAPAGSPAQS